ncbi:hypothetical protein T12_3836 [Trichinella patagoniensis]|uniref:Uncharacterized protein n=1 Tax=Trichinella patagoniensis TaxID=990121 RepID=A0A0V0YVP3_9BILA|nr:hypothetical protein T12_3836 [Trichinella patagoniensis]
MAPNCDWHRLSNSVRVLLGQFCSSLLLGLKSSALESLPCPVTILMVNCPFDIGDQENLVQDVRD